MGQSIDKPSSGGSSVDPPNLGSNPYLGNLVRLTPCGASIGLISTGRVFGVGCLGWITGVDWREGERKESVIYNTILSPGCLQMSGEEK